MESQSCIYDSSKDNGNYRQAKNQLIIDFGESVKLGEVETRHLHLRNESAIQAPFTFKVKNLAATLPAVPTCLQPTQSTRYKN